MFDIATITHAKKLDAEIKRLQKELDAIKDPMKAYMIENNLKEKTVGQYVVRLVSYDKETASVAKVKELCPDLASDIITTSPVNSLRI